MKKNLVLATIVTTVLSAGTAYADPVTLILETGAMGGSGADVNVNGIDLLPGNALAVDVITVPNSPPSDGTEFQLYFQAVLNSFNFNNLPTFSPTLVGTEVTAVAGFMEEVGGGGFPTAGFTFVEGGNNFFELYYDATPDADNLAGTGFNNGVLILSGEIISAIGSFEAAPGQPPFTTPFDSTPFPGDNGILNDYPGVTTVVGTGSTQVGILVDFVNTTYFTSSIPSLVGLVLTLDFTTQGSTPFTNVDPSAQFWDGSSLFPHQIGAINGVSGPDFQLQTDAAGVFSVTSQQVIPEPATLTLFGLGLAGSAMARRRQMKKAAK